VIGSRHLVCPPRRGGNTPLYENARVLQGASNVPWRVADHAPAEPYRGLRGGRSTGGRPKMDVTELDYYRLPRTGFLDHTFVSPDVPHVATLKYGLSVGSAQREGE
jgi:hypothetical protein